MDYVNSGVDMKQSGGYIPAMLDTTKIRKLRERAGLTQDEAAAAAGFTGRQGWNNIETGKRDNIELATLNRIAKVLDTRARDLLKG